MKIVDVEEAREHLPRLIEEACAGEDVVIARSGTPVVRLVPAIAETPRRRRGRLRGEIHVPDSFFDPLRDDELERWSG